MLCIGYLYPVFLGGGADVLILLLIVFSVAPNLMYLLVLSRG